MKKRIMRVQEMKKRIMRVEEMVKRNVVRKLHWLWLLFRQYQNKHPKRNALLFNSAL